MHDYGFGMGFGWFIPILLIVGAIYFFKYNEKNNKSLSPKEILDMRYANGEIDTDEYHEKLKALES